MAAGIAAAPSIAKAVIKEKPTKRPKGVNTEIYGHKPGDTRFKMLTNETQSGNELLGNEESVDIEVWNGHKWVERNDYPNERTNSGKAHG